MELRQNNIKVVAEEYASRIWDDGDLSAIDELIDSNVVIHSLFGIFHGREYMKKVVQAWLKGFPDLSVHNTATICEGDLAVMQWDARGSHLGEFKGIEPTGRAISYAGVTIYRVNGGKIVEYWAYLDMGNLLNQIKGD